MKSRLRCCRRGLRSVGCQNLHDFSGRATGVQQAAHDIHCRIDMIEKPLVGGAEIIEPGVAPGCPDKPVLRASAVAGKPHLAVAAVTRKRVPFIESEFPLLPGGRDFAERLFKDIP